MVRAAVMALLVGCGSHQQPQAVHEPQPRASDTQPKPPGPPRAAIPGLPAMTRAALVTVTGEGLVAYGLDGDRLSELGRVALGTTGDELSGPGDAWWIDREHIVVQLGYQGAFLVVTPTGSTSLPPPPDDAAYAAIPAPPLANGATDPPTRGGQQWGQIEDGKLVWHACVWGYAYDEGQCVRSATVQLWPPGDGKVAMVPDADTPSHYLSSREDGRWVDAPAAFEVGWASGMRSTCGGHARTTTLPKIEDGTSIGAVHWLANPGHASAALAVYEGMGATLMFTAGFKVFDRCTDKGALFGGDNLQLLPGQLWVGYEPKVPPGPNDDPNVHDDAKMVHRLHRGVATLGELPGASFVIVPP